MAVIAILGSSAAAIVYLRDGVDRMLAVLVTDALLLLQILPQAAAGCLIGVFVTLLLPREALARWAGAESGLAGLAVATMVGAIMPGGPITVFPVAAALMVAGADVGAAITFITSWMLLGYTRALVWEVPLFGPEFVLWRMAAALPLPILVGLLARYAVRIFPAGGEGPR